MITRDQQDRLDSFCSELAKEESRLDALACGCELIFPDEAMPMFRVNPIRAAREIAAEEYAKLLTQ